MNALLINNSSKAEAIKILNDCADATENNI
jgi:hypothetical protein